MDLRWGSHLYHRRLQIELLHVSGQAVVIVAGIITAHGVSGLLMVTIMAGVILMVMAVTGLGTAVKYIPRPVTIGFTNGIAILIASTQIKDFLGLETEAVPAFCLTYYWHGGKTEIP